MSLCHRVATMVSRSLWPSLFSILASRCWSPGSGKGGCWRVCPKVCRSKRKHDKSWQKTRSCINNLLSPIKIDWNLMEKLGPNSYRWLFKISVLILSLWIKNPWESSLNLAIAGRFSLPIFFCHLSWPSSWWQSWSQLNRTADSDRERLKWWR